MTAPVWFKRDIIKPANDTEREAVRHAQRVMGLPVTGEMDEPTIIRLRGLQHVFGLPMTGVLDAATAEEIERIRSYYSALPIE